MNEFKDYLKGRLICKKDKYSIIIPKDNFDYTSLYCDLCHNLLCSEHDEKAYEKFKCCDNCLNYLVLPNKSKWDSGWKPSKEDIEKIATQIFVIQLKT